MHNLISDHLFYNTMNQLPIGVFFLDEAKQICIWNDWMVERTAIKVDKAIGKKLSDLYPDFNHTRFSWALDMVLTTSCPQILSQVLNTYVIPVPLKLSNHFGIDMMQQKVQISPLNLDNGKIFAMVTIVDVTENVLQEHSLMESAALLQENSFRDPLTDLYNRRFLLDWLKKELLKAKRYAYPIVCFMIDLDHFKRINDKYGHEVGDRVLCDFAQILQSNQRESDICVRYGGEEFLVIMVHSSLRDALTRANMLVNKVQKSTLAQLNPGEVTCSIGISTYSKNNPCDHLLLIKQADEQLYRAKSEGRNRACSSQENPKSNE